MWNTGHWNDCSTPCGSGKQTRDVYCAKSKEEKVSSKYCSKTKLPIQSRKCYGKQCGKVCSIFIRHRLNLQGAKYIMLILSMYQSIGLSIHWAILPKQAHAQSAGQEYGTCNLGFYRYITCIMHVLSICDSLSY